MRWTSVGLLAAVVACCTTGAHARPKSSRDWSKLSDKDWEKISEEWETEEEKEEYEYKPPQQKGLDINKLKKAKGAALNARGAGAERSPRGTRPRVCEPRVARRLAARRK
jgi:23S rRNA G2445 N2-methylase RlmL